MPSVKQIIDGHNKAILKKAETTTLQPDEGKKSVTVERRRIAH